MQQSILLRSGEKTRSVDGKIDEGDEKEEKEEAVRMLKSENIFWDGIAVVVFLGLGFRDLGLQYYRGRWCWCFAIFSFELTAELMKCGHVRIRTQYVFSMILISCPNAKNINSF